MFIRKQKPHLQSQHTDQLTKLAKQNRNKKLQKSKKILKKTFVCGVKKTTNWDYSVEAPSYFTGSNY